MSRFASAFLTVFPAVPLYAVLGRSFAAPKQWRWYKISIPLTSCIAWPWQPLTPADCVLLYADMISSPKDLSINSPKDATDSCPKTEVAKATPFGSMGAGHLASGVPLPSSSVFDRPDSLFSNSPAAALPSASHLQSLQSPISIFDTVRLGHFHPLPCHGTRCTSGREYKQQNCLIRFTYIASCLLTRQADFWRDCLV